MGGYLCGYFDRVWTWLVSVICFGRMHLLVKLFHLFYRDAYERLLGERKHNLQYIWLGATSRSIGAGLYGELQPLLNYKSS